MTNGWWYNIRTALRRNFVMIVLLLAVIAISGVSAAWDSLSSERWFRDITLQTFHGVTAESEATDGGVVVRGVMIKRRCQYRGLRAYVLKGQWDQGSGCTGSDP